MPLTDARLRSLRFEDGQRDYPDRDGLFIHVGRKTKTFMVTVREGSTSPRRNRSLPDLALSAARTKARELQSEAKNKTETDAIIFADALENYLRIQGAKQRPKTRKNPLVS